MGADLTLSDIERLEAAADKATKGPRRSCRRGRNRSMSKLEEATEAFERLHLAERLALCTPEQQERFRAIYPNAVPRRDIRGACALIERTLSSNARAAQPGGTDDA